VVPAAISDDDGEAEVVAVWDDDCDDVDLSSSDEFLPALKRSSSSATKSSLKKRSIGTIDRSVVVVSPANETAKAAASSRPRSQPPEKGLSSIDHDIEDDDAKEFLDGRVMTVMQEHFNAVTMLPGMIYSAYFILAGCWIVGHQAGDGGNDNNDIVIPFQQGNNNNNEWVIDLVREMMFGNNNNGVERYFFGGCINIPAFPSLTALPPLTIIAAALGILLHSPISMMYHWKCATSLPPSERIKHWSRRLDNAFIHVASACASYATSGRVDYLLANVAFNAYCALGQFEPKVRPRRNLLRIALSILLYLLPVVVHGHYRLFLQFVTMFALCGWLFVGYPFGGWSHGMFHLVLSTLPYLVMDATMRLESSGVQIDVAVRCGGYYDNVSTAL